MNSNLKVVNLTLSKIIRRLKKTFFKLQMMFLLKQMIQLKIHLVKVSNIKFHQQTQFMLVNRTLDLKTVMFLLLKRKKLNLLEVQTWQELLCQIKHLNNGTIQVWLSIQTLKKEKITKITNCKLNKKSQGVGLLAVFLNKKLMMMLILIKIISLDQVIMNVGLVIWLVLCLSMKKYHFNRGINVQISLQL